MTTASLAATPASATSPVPRGRDVLLALVVSLGAMLLLAGLGVLAGATFLSRTGALVLAACGGSLGVWAGLWLTLRRRLGWGWRELGFVPGRRSPWHLLWQVPAALVVGTTSAAAVGAALGLGPEQGGATDSDLLAGAGLSPAQLVVVAVCAVLVLPAAEEVLFRRVLLDWALTRVPPAVAVLLTAAAFAAAHVAPVAMAYLVFVGVFTAVLRLWHGTLWAPLALHAANNGLVVLVAVQAL